MHGEFPEKGTEELEVDMRGDSRDCCKNVVIKLPPTFFIGGNNEWVYFPLFSKRVFDQQAYRKGTYYRSFTEPLYGADHWKNTTDYQKCTTNSFTVTVSEPTPFWKVLDDNIVAPYTWDEHLVGLKVPGGVVEWTPCGEGKPRADLYRHITICMEARWLTRYFSCEITNEQGEYWSHADRPYLLGHRDSFEDEMVDLDIEDDGLLWHGHPDELDFDGALEDDVYITIEEIGIQKMKLSDFKVKYGIHTNDSTATAGPSYKHFNKQLVGIKNDYAVFEGWFREEDAYKWISFETAEDEGFDPSKIKFVYSSDIRDQNYVTDFEYDGHVPDGSWEFVDFWETHTNFLRVKQTDKWKRTAGEAIVRWYKCVVAKRKLAEQK